MSVAILKVVLKMISTSSKEKRYGANSPCAIPSATRSKPASRDDSVGIAISYGPDGPGFEF